MVLDEIIVIEFEIVHSVIKSQMDSVLRRERDRWPEELRAFLQASILSL